MRAATLRAGGRAGRRQCAEHEGSEVKIAVVGAGAIGGYVGGLLSAAGEDVTFIARGANLDAIRRRGMKVVLEDGTEVDASECDARTSGPSDAGPQDVVFLTVKAHQVTPIAPELHHLCHETTSIVTMQNGIPWWYFQRLGGPYDGRAGEVGGSRRLDRAAHRPGAHRRVGRVSGGEPRRAGRRARRGGQAVHARRARRLRSRRASRRSRRA